MHRFIPMSLIWTSPDCALQLHRAPTPEPDEDPLPGEHPVPQQEPVPSPYPEIMKICKAAKISRQVHNA